MLSLIYILDLNWYPSLLNECLSLYRFLWFPTGFDWRHLMIEAHKNRHHNVSGKGSGSGGTYHWNSSSSSISSSSQSEANQKEPLFDWDASTVSTYDSQRIQEVTTTLGQTAFLHCRVRYLADRRVGISSSFELTPFSGPEMNTSGSRGWATTHHLIFYLAALVTVVRVGWQQLSDRISE